MTTLTTTPEPAGPPGPPTALGTALHALRLGLRDTFTLRALGSLLALWLASALFWLIVFLVFRAEIWHAVQSIATWAAMLGGVGTYFGNTRAAGAVGGLGATTGMALGFAAGGVLVVVAYWLCVVITVRVAMELLLMRSIQVQALRSYPLIGAAAPPATDDWRQSWLNPLGPLLGAAVVVPLCLVLPLVGGPLLAAFLAYLNVRTLVNDALDGIADAASVRAFVVTHRGQMLLLGGLLAALAFVPLVGFLLPWVTGSAVTHLVLRDRSDGLLPAEAVASDDIGPLGSTAAESTTP